MYSSSDKSYHQARAIKTGKHKLLPIHQELVDWLSKEFNVRALDFTFDTKETSKGYRQQVILIIVETKEESRQLNTPANEQRIAKRFMEYFLIADGEIKRKDLLKARIFPIDDKPFPEIIVGFHSLQNIEESIALTKAEEDIRKIPAKYSDKIWSIQSNGGYRTVFYFTDQQRKDSANDGTDAAIEKEIFDAMKKYDEFDYFGLDAVKILFDSKESFDRDFDGKWHYYYK